LKNDETTAELSTRYGVHPTMITKWKKELIEGATDVFDKNGKRQKQSDAQIDELYRQIGKLQVERDFLSRKLSL